VWLRRGDLVDGMRASFSLPGLFPPVEVEGRWLVDGGLVNPVPVSVCRAMGAKVVIGVNLNSDPVGRIGIPGHALPGATGFELLHGFRQGKHDQRLGSWLRGLLGHDHEAPSAFGSMVQSLSIMLDRVTRGRYASDPPDVAINPRVGHIAMFEFDRAAEAIAEGEVATERALAELVEAIAMMGTPSQSDDSDTSWGAGPEALTTGRQRTSR
jgi:NTE family protein